MSCLKLFNASARKETQREESFELESGRNKSRKQQEGCAFQHRKHENLWRSGGEFSAPRTATVQTQPGNTDLTYLAIKFLWRLVGGSLFVGQQLPFTEKEICLQSSDATSGRKLSQSSEAAERMRQVPKPDPRPGTGSLLKVSVQSTLTSKEKIKRL